MEDAKNHVIEALREVYDPEIPVNVYDLGLIYDIKVEDDNVHILMSLTSPTCPTADYIQEMIKEAVEALDFTKEVTVELTFDPPWTPDRVSMDAKEELGLQTESPDIATQSVYEDIDSKKENICFKCQISDSKVPLIKVMYKSDELLICNSCLNKL